MREGFKDENVLWAVKKRSFAEEKITKYNLPSNEGFSFGENKDLEEHRCPYRF